MSRTPLPARPLISAGAAAAALLVLLWAAGPPVAAAAGAFEPVREVRCRPDQFKIALDVGHHREKPGATSATGVPELTFNQRLAGRIADDLQARGFHRTLIIGMDGDAVELAERTRAAERFGAQLFVSIHHDSVQPRYLETWTVDGREHQYSDRFRGHSLFVSEQNADPRQSLLFAHLVGRELTRRGLTPSLHHAEPIPGEGRPLIDAELGIHRFDDLVVLKTAAMPAVLIEAGVIVNRDEEAKLASDAYQRTLATAIGQAVAAFCMLVSPP